MDRIAVQFFFGSLFIASLAYGQAVTTVPQTLERGAEASDFSDGNSSVALDPASLLPDLPPIPAAKATLVGGVVGKLDRIQDRVIVELFGGGKTSVLFDGRTLVYRDGQPASAGSLKIGDRVYIDTILFDGKVFARSIRLKTNGAKGESQGVVVSYRPERGELVIRDVTAPDPVKLRVSAQTRIVQGDQPSSSAELRAGSLVSIQFDARTGRNVAEQISILAAPGTMFTFAGKVTFLDLHAGLIVLTSDTNRRTYEVYLDPAMPIDAKLREGSQVTARAQFEGSRYVTRDLTVNASSEK